MDKTDGGQWQKKTGSIRPPFFSGTNVDLLNFLRTPPSHCFRRHFRGGLRSHLFELVLAEDVQTEQTGEIIDNIRQFPRARPTKMLRVLQSRFDSLNQALGEIKKYRILLKFIGPALVAKSEEFIFDCRGSGQSKILLCGLQEYIEGSILDPWHLAGREELKHFYRPNVSTPCRKFVQRAATDIKAFVKAIRTMISATGHIPDLAGVGNLMLTPEGGLKLVDINNIIEIKQDATIRLDDKGYPCCDKSVEVLSILEHRILQQPISMDDPIYKRFLCPGRREQVRILEEAFYQSL